MEIAFYEVEDWERERLRSELPGHDLRFYRESLTAANASLATMAEVVSVFIRSQVDAQVLAQLPRLRLLATRSTGYDHVDLPACVEKGVAVSNVPFYGENTVAEHTFGLILALSRNLLKAYVRTSRGDFDLAGLEGFDIKGKTLGVVGAGSIGLHVIRIAKGFGMQVLAYDVRENHLLAEVLAFQYLPLEELFARSDVVTLHTPYLPATYHLVDREALAKFKRGALLINTARGGLVDTDALIWALDEGILAGAGLDVLEGEEVVREDRELLLQPQAEDKLRMVLRRHILLQRDKVVITPHIAFYSREALERIEDTTAANIRAFLAGQPQNLVEVPPAAGRAA